MLSIRRGSARYNSPEMGPVTARLGDGIVHWKPFDLNYDGPNHSRHTKRRIQDAREQLVDATRRIGEYKDWEEVHCTYLIRMDDEWSEAIETVPLRAAQVQEAMLAAFRAQPELYEPRLFQWVRNHL